MNYTYRCSLSPTFDNFKKFETRYSTDEQEIAQEFADEVYIEEDMCLEEPGWKVYVENADGQKFMFETRLVSEYTLYVDDGVPL